MLIKEPLTTNPFRLIHNVLKYASKTKHPRLRSAFTYCEDDPPSRIDFGKSKYGGPFTTEQVEDVKTFFRVLGIIIIAGASISITKDSETFMRNTLEVYGHQVLNGECLQGRIQGGALGAQAPPLQPRQHTGFYRHS